jgi:peptide chain release factor subunit 1
VKKQQAVTELHKELLKKMTDQQITSLNEIDLQEVSRITTDERSCLSIFLSKADSLKGLEHKLNKLRTALNTSAEKEHFDENVKMVKVYLDKNRYKKGSLAILACWIHDFFNAIPTDLPLPDKVVVDSSPFIKPLAVLQDDYENTGVVVADNKSAKIFTVYAGIAEDAGKIKGKIKNHVKVGGWSQQRYERRRDKEIHHYAKDIVDKLSALKKEESFRRIILVGGKEILSNITKKFPKELLEITTQQHFDLGKPEEIINQELYSLLASAEIESETELFEKIKDEFLQDGLGAFGIEQVLPAALHFQIEKLIVNKDFHPAGSRCNKCGNLNAPYTSKCENCSTEDLFEVDLVNEITELVKQGNGDVDFVTHIKELDELGSIGALLRYRY